MEGIVGPGRVRYTPVQGERRMYWVIDRFEGETAVCQNDAKTMRNIPRSALPPGMKEGDVLVQEGTAYRPDPAETARRNQAVRDLQKGLWA